MPPWYRVVTDRAVVRRALITGLGVGTVLTLVNQGDHLLAGSLPPSSLLPIALTYVVPFVVSIGSSVLAIRVERRDGALTTDLLEREIDAINRFPGQNPHPVLRMTETGRLTYANDASAPVRAALGVEVGDSLSSEMVGRLRGAATANPPEQIELIAGEGRTFRLKPVSVPEFDFVNLYGTDVTAEKAVDKFPNENPNPVLRLTRGGRMTYANPASALVRRALGAEVGDALAPEMLDRVEAALESDASPLELEADGRTFAMKVVRVHEFDSINLYGTDITAARQVEALSAANEELLLNILPRNIAERLRAGERVIADRFDDMAVLFADVVGFTELSSRLEPDAVVTLLNDIFSECDRLTERFHLEKIKTVGDAYMVVGGLQTVYGYPQEAHASFARDVALMGLAIIEEMARFGRAWGTPLEVRVGMNVGPAVAGVIGIRKFIYDVWGDTVNTASRMESTGLPGRIQVTRGTYERLAGDFEFERRGTVDVKGKGPTETWFLTGPRAPG